MAYTQQVGPLVGTGYTFITYGIAQGCSVALSSDGNTLAVGGFGDNDTAGATWIFTRSGGAWTQQGSKLVGTGATGSISNQGFSVALSGDGNTLALGAPGDDTNIGATWIFTRSGGAWTQQGTKLVGTGYTNGPLNVFQGIGVALSNDGNTLAVGGGTAVTSATFTVNALRTVSINSTPQNGGSANDTGDRFSFSGTYGGGTWTTPLVVVVTSSTAGVASGVAIYSPGVWSGTAAPVNTIGATRTQTYGTMDMNGINLQVTLTDWGVDGVTVANGGDYTAVPSNPVSTSGSGNGNAKLNVTYGVKSVAITNAGSHYISAADASVTFSGGAAAGTSVLTNLYQSGLAVYVYLPGGSTGVIADIMKQESSHRYLVKTRDNNGAVGQCRLVAKNAGSLSVGEMCLIATDSNGSTYWVTKLTARRAILTRRTMNGSYLFATNGFAGWTIGSASTGVVSIANV
jgi:hypothetical protein